MRTIPKNNSPRARAAAAASEAALRARGLRLTHPRRLVLEAVRATAIHPTAEWVHQAVRRRLPRVSLGTVYRNLRLLVDQGLIKEIAGPQARFDGNQREHHHFTCLRCRRIVDVDEPLPAVPPPTAQLDGFTVTRQRVEFYGWCPACRPRGRPDGRWAGRRNGNRRSPPSP
jgi:Fe2+ or Zn2+ uptake regulation protein